jgi:hypothetical protein
MQYASSTFIEEALHLGRGRIIFKSVILPHSTTFITLPLRKSLVEYSFKKFVRWDPLVFNHAIASRKKFLSFSVNTSHRVWQRIQSSVLCARNRFAVYLSPNFPIVLCQGSLPGPQILVSV